VPFIQIVSLADMFWKENGVNGRNPVEGDTVSLLELSITTVRKHKRCSKKITLVTLSSSLDFST